jgi:hypothetical protein
MKAYLEVDASDDTKESKFNLRTKHNQSSAAGLQEKKKKKRKLLGESVSPRNGIGRRILQCRKYFWYRIPEVYDSLSEFPLSSPPSPIISDVAD